VVHVGPGLLDDLDCPGLHRKVVGLCPSPSPFALVLNRIVTGGRSNRQLGGFDSLRRVIMSASSVSGADFVASLFKGGGIGMAAIVQACEGEGGGGKVFSVHGGRWLVLKRFLYMFAKTPYEEILQEQKYSTFRKTSLGRKICRSKLWLYVVVVLYQC
jgi:hypothetical protein